MAFSSNVNQVRRQAGESGKQLCSIESDLKKKLNEVPLWWEDKGCEAFLAKNKVILNNMSNLDNEIISLVTSLNSLGAAIDRADAEKKARQEAARRAGNLPTR